MSQDIVVVDTPAKPLAPLCQALSSHGYTPVVVHTEAELLARLEQQGCELVFLHLAVPQAAAICDAMRNSMAGSIVPAIFVGTAAAQNDAIRSPADALSAGGDYYFAQPLEMKRVLVKVQTYVGLSSQQDDDTLQQLDLDGEAGGAPASASPPSGLADASDALLAQIKSREEALAQTVHSAPPTPQGSHALQFDAAPVQPAALATPAPDPAPAPVASPAAAPARATARSAAPTYRPLTPASGTLGPQYDMANLLCDAFAQRVTGRIVLENGHDQRTLYLLDGSPVHVLSQHSVDRLEEYLLRSKKLSADHYQQVRMRGLRRGAQVRAYVAEKSLLGSDALAEALHAQLKEQLSALFWYSNAQFSYSPQLCEPQSRIHLRQDVRRLVMQAIRDHFVLGQLQARVGAAASHVAVRPEQQQSLDALCLSGAELALLSLLDGHRSLHDVAALSGLKLERVYQAVYGMLCVDAAQVVQHVPLQHDDALVASDAAAASRLQEKLQQVRMQDYFAMLEIDSQADPSSIEAAYRAVTQSYAPAAFSAAVQSQYRQALAEIATVLQEAHAVLSNPHLRSYYSSHAA